MDSTFPLPFGFIKSSICSLYYFLKGGRVSGDYRNEPNAQRERNYVFSDTHRILKNGKANPLGALYSVFFIAVGPCQNKFVSSPATEFLVRSTGLLNPADKFLDELV